MISYQLSQYLCNKNDYLFFRETLEAYVTPEGELRVRTIKKDRDEVEPKSGEDGNG